jgi:hypothetical protein
VDNTNRGLDNSRYRTKTEFNNCFIIYSKARKKAKPFCLRFYKYGLANNGTRRGLVTTACNTTLFDQSQTRIDFEYIITRINDFIITYLRPAETRALN